MDPVATEDTHFYIDYAPPEEVRKVLQCLSAEQPLTPTEIFDLLDYQGRSVRSRRTEMPRRLADLGLASQKRSGNQIAYVLSELGSKLQHVDSFAPDLYPDLLHFLHLSWDGAPHTRKLLWSYRQCSELLWQEGRLLSTKEIAAKIQDQMMETFKHLDYTAQSGGRFDDTAASRWIGWIRELSPPPVDDNSGSLQKRTIFNHELVLLALDDVYRRRKYRFGDPVILDEGLLDEIARVFFLDHICCRELIDLAARLTRTVRLSDTFAGTSITLLEPYGIERI